MQRGDAEAAETERRSEQTGSVTWRAAQLFYNTRMTFSSIRLGSVT